MLLGYPIGEIALLALWIAGAGVLVGILAGLFGIGGGAIIVPVLYEVFRVLGVPEDIRMQACIGTSLAIIVPTTVRSSLEHKKKGAVIPDVVRIWALPATIGVLTGAIIAHYAPAQLFKTVFVVFAAFIGVRMLVGTTRGNLGSQLPGRPLLTFYGFLTGLVAALVGVSGGSVSNAVLTSYGRPMQQAVATSAGVGVPITIAGTLGYMLAGWPYMAQMPLLSIGFVSLIGFAFMAPVSSYTASYGVQLAHWLPRRKLEIAFAIFLFLVSLRFLISMLV
jgi:uncharacterized membrane protein YfcA